LSIIILLLYQIFFISLIQTIMIYRQKRMFFPQTNSKANEIVERYQ